MLYDSCHAAFQQAYTAGQSGNCQQNKEETNKDYRFYDLLPQQQVTPIPEQAVPETKDKSPVVIIEAPANNQPASEATGLSAQPGLEY